MNFLIHRYPLSFATGCEHYLILILWGTWIVPVAVLLLNLAIFFMDIEFRPLVAANPASSVNGFPFRLKMPAATLSAIPLYVPAAFRIMNNMMGT